MLFLLLPRIHAHIFSPDYRLVFQPKFTLAHITAKQVSIRGDTKPANGPDLHRVRKIDVMTIQHVVDKPSRAALFLVLEIKDGGEQATRDMLTGSPGSSSP